MRRHTGCRTTTPQTRPGPYPGRDPRRRTSHPHRLPNSRVTINSVVYMIGRPYARQAIHALWDPETIQFFDDQGTHITSYPCPGRGAP